MPVPSPESPDSRLFTFHPRIVALMSGVMGLSLIAVFGVIWVRLPADARETFSWFQRITLLAFFGAVLWILYRLTTLRVTAYPDRLYVRNVFKSYTLPWPGITALRFRSGDAWLQLFDGDGNRLGILAVQAAEGSRASRAAKELAAVAREHGAGPQRSPLK